MIESDVNKIYKGADRDFHSSFSNWKYGNGFFKNYFSSYNIFGNISLDKCDTDVSMKLSNQPTYTVFMKDVMENSCGLTWFFLLPIASVVWFFQNLSSKRWKKKNAEKFI